MGRSCRTIGLQFSCMDEYVGIERRTNKRDHVVIFLIIIGRGKRGKK